MKKIKSLVESHKTICIVGVLLVLLGGFVFGIGGVSGKETRAESKESEPPIITLYEEKLTVGVNADISLQTDVIKSIECDDTIRDVDVQCESDSFHLKKGEGKTKNGVPDFTLSFAKEGEYTVSIVVESSEKVTKTVAFHVNDNLISYVKGIKNLTVDLNAEKVDYLKDISYDKNFVKEVKVDSSKVDLKKEGTYTVVYTIIPVSDTEKSVQKEVDVVVKKADAKQDSSDAKDKNKDTENKESDSKTAKSNTEDKKSSTDKKSDTSVKNTSSSESSNSKKENQSNTSNTVNTNNTNQKPAENTNTSSVNTNNSSNHVHQWVKYTDTINHPEVSHVEYIEHSEVSHIEYIDHPEVSHIEYIEHPAETHEEYRVWSECFICHADITDFEWDHLEEHALKEGIAGGYADRVEYYTVVDKPAWTEEKKVIDKAAWTEEKKVVDKAAWTEEKKVVDKAAWTETVVTYKCSCGAQK